MGQENGEEAVLKGDFADPYLQGFRHGTALIHHLYMVGFEGYRGDRGRILEDVVLLTPWLAPSDFDDERRAHKGSFLAWVVTDDPEEQAANEAGWLDWLYEYFNQEHECGLADWLLEAWAQAFRRLRPHMKEMMALHEKSRSEDPSFDRFYKSEDDKLLTEQSGWAP